jgi:hypothetical protein
MNNRLFSVSDDKCVYLWSMMHWGVDAQFRGHSRCVVAMVSDPAMKLYTAGFDGELRSWDCGAIIAKMTEVEAVARAQAKKKAQPADDGQKKPGPKRR